MNTPRVISFDFSGTLSHYGVFDDKRWHTVYEDTTEAITNAGLLYPNLRFAVVTDGAPTSVELFLREQQIYDMFLNKVGQSLIAHAGMGIKELGTKQVQKAPTLREKIMNRPPQYESVAYEKITRLRAKPAPDMLQFIMKSAGVDNPQHVVHIGDDKVDADMAAACKTHFIDVGFGKSNYPNMLSLLVDAVDRIA